MFDFCYFLDVQLISFNMFEPTNGNCNNQKLLDPAPLQVRLSFQRPYWTCLIM
ncbi:hypothetical protein BDR03DRAFT_35486 [Suillus americanus]|nr:hypothetical protein BDR03DRAFT_35486 [Suillus americanus]